MTQDDPGKAHSDWIATVVEDVLEPEIPILDPHHHLWLDEGHTGWPYTLEDFHKDTGSGHNIVGTVFLECHAEYRKDGPIHLRPVGETEFIADLAEQSAVSNGAEIKAIQGNADVSLGAAVEEVLEAHENAGQGRFRGVRYITAQNDHPPLAMSTNAAMDDPMYLEGVRRVGELGYTYDAMVYHPQLPQFADVARACPDTPIVLDHLGCVLGTGPYKDRREEILEFWKAQMAEIAAYDNVFLKLGGIGMPMMGFRWDKRDRPASSVELVEAWSDPIQYAIEVIGAKRCMFESNFPVDKRGAGYVPLWNSFKLIAADCSADEKRDLFHDTAARAYQLPLLTHA
tara:strand:- start:2666 stop:3691 length:1026 start_codon:yes stop_codon:yes gene_type:complete